MLIFYIVVPFGMAKVLGGRVSDNDYENLINNLKAKLQYILVLT